MGMEQTAELGANADPALGLLTEDAELLVFKLPAGLDFPRGKAILPHGL